MKRGQGASAPPPSPLSWRPTIRRQPSRLTVARGASICRSISFSRSAAARPSPRAGARSSNPMRPCSRPSSNATESPGAAHRHLGNGDGLREGARESEYSVGCGDPRLRLPTVGLFHRPALRSSDTNRSRNSLGRHARLHARRDRPNTVLAQDHPRVWHRRKSRHRGRRAVLDGKFPQSPWLERGCGIPARRSQFRSYPGMECCSGLSTGHCAYWPTDRRRRGHLWQALKGCIRIPVGCASSSGYTRDLNLASTIMRYSEQPKMVTAAP